MFKAPKVSGFGRTFSLLFFYVLITSFSLILSYYLRYDFVIPVKVQSEMWFLMIPVVGVQIIFLYFFKQFNSLLTYFRLPDVLKIFFALLLSSFIFLIFWFATGGEYGPPRGVILANVLFSLIFLSSFRLGLRVFRERYMERAKMPKDRKRVLIIGATDLGSSLAAELMARRSIGLKPVGFLDVTGELYGQYIHGVPVVGGVDELSDVKEKLEISQAIITLPGANPSDVNSLSNSARRIGLDISIVPAMHELASGNIKASKIRSVEIEDVLGREAIELDCREIQKFLKGKVVLVTGAGGSIGSELCRQIAYKKPSRLVMLDSNEGLLYNVEQELIELGFGGVIVALVGNVLDRNRLGYVFKRYKPEIVFHAAAHKHVPLMESQPQEALKNNTLGTSRLALIASENKVKHFIMISTDKAVKPTNVMGATKRLSEIYVQSLQKMEGNETNFMVVRFGNVLGSSGSVIPLMKRQIMHGGPVTVTHPEISRYFMTQSEAVGLVLQSAAQGEGGEIFVLNMGKPVKIVSLAKQLIRLSGFEPDVDIEIKYIGLRPGEKLYEELQCEGEHLVETGHPRIFRFVSEDENVDEFHAKLNKLFEGLEGKERSKLKQEIHEILSEYTPYFEA